MASWDEPLGKVRELVTYLRESSDSLSWQKEKESWGQGASFLSQTNLSFSGSSNTDEVILSKSCCLPKQGLK